MRTPSAVGRANRFSRLDDRLAAPDQFTGQPIMDKEPAKLAGLPYRLDGFAVFNKIKQ